MTHTSDERLLERPIIGPFGKGSIDVRVVNRGYLDLVLQW
jgi:hypothetical protein